MLEDLSAHTCRGLLSLDHGAVAEIALDKKYDLIVTHEDFIAADIVEPALHQCLDANFVLVGACAGRGQRWGYGGNQGLRVRGYQVFGKFDKLRV